MPQSKPGRKSRPRPEEIARLKNQGNRPPRGAYQHQFQVRVTEQTRAQIDALTHRVGLEQRNGLIRQWIDQGLVESLESKRSALIADLVDQVNRGIDEIPELTDLIKLCDGSRESAVEVINSIRPVDYHQPIEWRWELCKALALVAACKMGVERSEL